jgi:hypothetical protein
MPRTTEEILKHASELARRFEEHEPDPEHDRNAGEIATDATPAPPPLPSDATAAPVPPPDRWRCGHCRWLQAQRDVSRCEFCGGSRSNAVPQ